MHFDVSWSAAARRLPFTAALFVSLLVVGIVTGIWIFAEFSQVDAADMLSEERVDDPREAFLTLNLLLQLTLQLISLFIRTLFGGLSRRRTLFPGF